MNKEQLIQSRKWRIAKKQNKTKNFKIIKCNDFIKSTLALCDVTNDTDPLPQVSDNTHSHITASLPWVTFTRGVTFMPLRPLDGTSASLVDPNSYDTVHSSGANNWRLSISQQPPAAPLAAWILSLFGLSWQENAPQLPPVQLPLAASVSPVKCGCCMSATANTSGQDKGSLRAKGSKKTCSDEDERVEKCKCTKGVRVTTLETNSWKLLCVSRTQYSLVIGDWKCDGEASLSVVENSTKQPEQKKVDQ